MKNYHADTNVIYLKHTDLNHKPTSFKPKKPLTNSAGIARTSVLGVLVAEGYIPKAYHKTISQYEILRNHSLADGPNRPRCIVMGKPKLARKYTHTYVRDVDIQKAERIYKIWQDSIHILESYRCKDTLDSLLRMEGVANDQALLALGEIHNLRCGLRALTRYYGKQMAA